MDTIHSCNSIASNNIGTAVSLFATDQLHETPENWTLYNRPNTGSDEWKDFLKSVLENGILAPLEISADDYVISGHRRLSASREIGNQWIPCIVDNSIVMEGIPSADRIKLLIERNRGQRVKTDSEQILEAIAQVDPAEAIRQAQEQRAQHFIKAKGSSEEVFAEGSIRRTDPAGCRSEILAAVIDIIRSYRQEMGEIAISGRSIHYQLLQRKVRTSTYSSGYIYGTEKGSAGLLSKLLTDARSEGLIPDDWIDDSTRPTYSFESEALGPYVRRITENLFSNFFSAVHADQPSHVEILLEKNTIYGLVASKVAYPLRLPLTSMHGYGSYPAARDVAKRFKKSGKESLIVVYVSDLDPEGINMPCSWKKYLDYDFGVDATVLRAAVTTEQVEKYSLPPDADVKLSSSRASGFIEEYGNQCWELDSMPPKALVEEITNVCKGCLDIDRLNDAFERERESDVKLAQMRAAVQDFIKAKCSGILGEDAR